MKYDGAIKSQVTLATMLIYFERSYVVPHSCKVSQPGLTDSAFMTKDSFRPPPRLFNVKKSLLG